jgi:hypothetical protein
MTPSRCERKVGTRVVQARTLYHLEEAMHPRDASSHGLRVSQRLDTVPFVIVETLFKTMDPRTHVLSKGVSALVWIALGLCVFVIATDKYYQWDFKIFHSAPTALHTGDNPYDGANPPFHYPEQMPFLYPPVTLYAFEPLSKVRDRTARLAWLAAKLVALGLLVLLWHRHFEPLNFSFPVVLFLALGYNAALLRDLAAGNISIFEQLGIWLGFYLLVRNRPYLAGLVLAVTAQFKLLPAVLLGTVLFVGPPGRWKPFAASVAAFGALFSLNFLLTPQLMEQYMGALGGAIPYLDDRGEFAPSALALIRDVADHAATWGVRVSHSGADLAYLTYAGVFALVLLWLAWKHRAALASRDPRWVIYCSQGLFVHPSADAESIFDTPNRFFKTPTYFVDPGAGRADVRSGQRELCARTSGPASVAGVLPAMVGGVVLALLSRPAAAGVTGT